MPQKIIILIFIISLCLCGCSTQKKESANGKEEIVSEAGYEFELLEYSKQIEYNGTPVNIHYKLNNLYDPIDIGIMIFLDGIVQPFYTDEFSEKNYMHVYDFAKDETRTVSIYFEPQSGSFGEHLLTVITMLNTNFRAKGPIYDFGYNHRISFISDTIYFKQDLGESKAEKKDSYTQANISADERAAYQREDDTNRLDDTAFFHLLNQNKIIERQLSLNLTDLDLKGLGGFPATYRTSLFLNHEPIKIDGKYDYIEMKIDKNQFSKSNISFDPSKLQEGDILYTISIPIDTRDSFPVKSDSIILLN